MSRTLPALLVAMALVFVACGDDAAVFATTSPAIEPTATTAAPSATALSTTTLTPTTLAPATTAPPATAAPTTTTGPPVFVVDPANFFPDPLPGSDLAHGSGCVTDATVLGDGVWFGFAVNFYGNALGFDLACFWTGAAAVAAATADGAEAFDFYIRNVNPKIYEVPIHATADVYWIDPGAAEWPSPVPIPLTAWPNSASFLACPGTGCSVWLYVNAGKVTAIVEQYLP